MINECGTYRKRTVFAFSVDKFWHHASTLSISGGENLIAVLERLLKKQSYYQLPPDLSVLMTLVKVYRLA